MLKKNMSSISEFDEAKFEEMRERTEAYFKKYVEIEEGDWTIVVPSEDYQKLNAKNKGLLK